MGISDWLESMHSVRTHITAELYICFILWRLVVLITQNPMNPTVRSLMRYQKMTLTSPRIMNIETIIMGRKQKTLTVMNTNKLAPKEGLLLRHRNLWING